MDGLHNAAVVSVLNIVEGKGLNLCQRLGVRQSVYMIFSASFRLVLIVTYLITNLKYPGTHIVRTLFSIGLLPQRNIYVKIRTIKFL